MTTLTRSIMPDIKYFRSLRSDLIDNSANAKFQNMPYLDFSISSFWIFVGACS